MTREQYERWKDFALRMARTCYARSQRPDARWIAGEVEHFFDCGAVEDVHECIVDYCNGRREPVRGGEIIVSDMVSEFLDGEAPDFFTDDWSYFDADVDMQEEREELAWHQWDNQWANPVKCCIRAGLDAVTQTGPGVLGFTAGEIRRMYPEGVPGWIFDPCTRVEIWHLDSGKVEPNGFFGELPDEAHVAL